MFRSAGSFVFLSKGPIDLRPPVWYIMDKPTLYDIVEGLCAVKLLTLNWGLWHRCYKIYIRAWKNLSLLTLGKSVTKFDIMSGYVYITMPFVLDIYIDKTLFYDRNWWIGKNVERNNRDLIEVLFRTLPRGTEKIHEQLQSWWSGWPHSLPYISFHITLSHMTLWQLKVTVFTSCLKETKFTARCLTELVFIMISNRKLTSLPYRYKFYLYAFCKFMLQDASDVLELRWTASCLRDKHRDIILEEELQ
jgi:hypothetical protein